MEFIEEAVVVVKDTFDAVCKKTGEAVNVGKMKYNIASMKSKLSKDYETLGRLCLDSVLEGAEIPSTAKEVAEDIVKRKEQIKAAKAELYRAKGKQVCPECSKVNPQDARFCNDCGHNF